jgi:flagellin-like protein
VSVARDEEGLIEMKTHSNETAVSPVIGVILMIAITVILAAVIAAFVFGMAGQMQSPKVVAVTASMMNTSYVTITNQGGQDVASLTSLDVTGDIVTPGTVGVAVGNRATFQTTPGISQKQIIVTATYSDGSQRVVLNTWVSRTIA